MKIDFTINISHLVIAALCCMILVMLFSRKESMGKLEQQALLKYYFEQSDQIARKERQQIQGRLLFVDSLQAEYERSKQRQAESIERLDQINKKLRQIEKDINRPINWADSTTGAIDSFWAKRIGR